MRTRPAAAVVAVLAVVGLVVSVTAAWSRVDPGPADQVVEPGPAAAAVVPGPPEQERAQEVVLGSARQPKIGRSDATSLRKATRQPRTPRPVRARLGSLGIDAAVRPVGVQKDGQMRLPDDPRVLGWYRFGAAPGAGSGATVLAGHLDSQRFGLGPLVRLRDMQVRDTFRVGLANGKTKKYVVKRINRYDRQGLPDALFSRTGPERLHLITCGGAYDADNGGYQLNLVVTAVPAR